MNRKDSKDLDDREAGLDIGPETDIPSEANAQSDFINILRPYDQIQIVIFGVTVFMFCAHVTIVIWPLWALMNGAASSPVFGPVFLFKGIWFMNYMTHTYKV